MANYLRPRRGKKATAISQNIILKKGEIFLEMPDTGTGTGIGKIKIGDGVTGYADLPYFNEGSGKLTLQINGEDAGTYDGNESVIDLDIPVVSDTYSATSTDAMSGIAVADAFDKTVATVKAKGLVKPDGDTITIDEDGTIHGVGGDGSYIIKKSLEEYNALTEEERQSNVYWVYDSENGITVLELKEQLDQIASEVEDLNKVASTDTLGMVKVDGTTIKADENGVISADITVGAAGGSNFAITLVSNTGLDIKNQSITLSIDGKEYTAVTDDEGKAEIKGVTEVGTATFSCPDYTSSKILIKYYSNYTIKITDIGLFQEVLLAAGYSITAYKDIEALLADEPAVRRVMTIHNSADKLLEWINSDITILDTLCNNRVSMKWIGLRDYLCDKLLSSEEFTEKLLASDYWEYILKDKVPTMTSATAPEGTVSCSSYYTGAVNGVKALAYKAFDNIVSDADGYYWVNNYANNGKAVGQWLRYDFVNPICVKKVSIIPFYDSYGCRLKDFEIQASNDNFSTYDVICSGTAENKQYESINISVGNYKYYKSYRLYITSEGYNSTVADCISIKLLQFYGRSLNESVPVMTSDTAPLGEAFASTENTLNIGYYAFRAFNKTNTDEQDSWQTDSDRANGAYIGYKFCKDVKIRGLKLTNKYSYPRSFKNFKVQISNDGVDWTDVISLINPTNDAQATTIFTFDNNYYAKYVRLYNIESYVDGMIGVGMLDFYGVSYSEEEFGDDGISMVYDNGITYFPQDSVYYGNKSDVSITVEDDAILLTDSTSSSAILTRFKKDITDDKCIVTEISDKAVACSIGITTNSNTTNEVWNGYYIAAASTNINTNISTETDTSVSQKLSIDCSTVSGENYVSFGTFSAATGSLRIRKVYLLK